MLYEVRVTSVWQVEADSKEEAEEIYSDGNQIDTFTNVVWSSGEEK